jgi:hypothetical protein
VCTLHPLLQKAQLLVTPTFIATHIVDVLKGLVVRCEPPTVTITQFNGSLKMPSMEKWVALTNKQLLIRVLKLPRIFSFFRELH